MISNSVKVEAPVDEFDFSVEASVVSPIEIVDSVDGILFPSARCN